LWLIKKDLSLQKNKIVKYRDMEIKDESKEIENHIICDSEIRGGAPVFKGTRIPFEILFDYLAEGSTIDDFIRNYPSISKEKVIDVLDLAVKFYVKAMV
jgi:uncharacterized protein (DUF433 family)